MDSSLTSNPFVIAFVLVFLAELGDKTQLVALAFATRYRVSLVLTGAAIGTVVVTGLSVGLGATIGHLIADHWLQIVTGVLLIVFAVLIAREQAGEEDGEWQGESGLFGPVMGIAMTFFIAELGDKTMLATIGIAAQSGRYGSVWAGAALGMILANVIGVVLGHFAARKLPQKTIRWAAATLFFASGVFIAMEGFRSLHALR